MPDTGIYDIEPQVAEAGVYPYIGRTTLWRDCQVFRDVLDRQSAWRDRRGV